METVCRDIEARKSCGHRGVVVVILVEGARVGHHTMVMVEAIWDQQIGVVASGDGEGEGVFAGHGLELVPNPTFTVLRTKVHVVGFAKHRRRLHLSTKEFFVG